MRIKAGRKNDSNKLRYDLIPPHALERVAEVYTLGAKKYGDRNWEKGLSRARLEAALMRHFEAWRKGEEWDPEDGQHHLASVVFCCLALIEFSRRGKLNAIYKPDSS